MRQFERFCHKQWQFIKEHPDASEEAFNSKLRKVEEQRGNLNDCRERLIAEAKAAERRRVEVMKSLEVKLQAVAHEKVRP